MWVVWLATENITTGRIPLFYERDDAFLTYIRELTKDTATSRDELSDELDRVWYMFSHIILSNYNLATEFDYSALREVECHNGFRMLVRRPAEDLILIVGISADVAGSSLNEVHRRLDMLLTILTFLFGPSYDFHLSRKATLEQRKHNWDTISLLLNKWHQMFNTEQCYLVEAIEEITTDTAYGARARPGDAMEGKVEAILNEARKIVQLKLGCTYDYVIHTMLVVESKIVQFNSSAKDRAVSPYDMLLMLLSSLSYFPSNMVPEDLFSRTQRRIDCASSILSEDSDEDQRLELPGNLDGSGSDRYFDNVMLDEELTATEPSDSQSVASAHSTEDYTSMSSEYVEKGRKSVEFHLGDSRLPTAAHLRCNKPEDLLMPKLPNDSRLQNGTTPGLGQAFLTIAKSQCEFVEVLSHPSDNEMSNRSVPEHSQSTANSKHCDSTHSASSELSGNCIQEPAVPASTYNKSSLIKPSDCDSGTESLQSSAVTSTDSTVENITNGTMLEHELTENEHRPTTEGCSCGSDTSQSEHFDVTQSNSGDFTPVVLTNGGTTLHPSDVSVGDTNASILANMGVPNGVHEAEQSLSIESTEAAEITKPVTSAVNHVIPEPSISTTTQLAPAVFDVKPVLPYQIIEEKLSSLEHSDHILSKTVIASKCVNNNNATLSSVEPHSADLQQTIGHVTGSVRMQQSAGSVTTNSHNMNALSLAKSAPLVAASSHKHFPVSHSLPRLVAHPSGREKREAHRVASLSGSSRRSSLDTPVTRRRHLSWQGNDSTDQLTDEYHSASSPQLSPILPHRRPSADSEASFHTATTLLRPGPEYPLDTEKLRSRVLAKHDPHHMIKGVFVHKRIFLRSSLCEYVPACLYMISVSPGINIVVAAEITDPHKPNKFVEALNHLTWLLNPRCFDNNKKFSPERLIDRMADKLKDLVELITLRIHNSSYRKTLDTTVSLWLRMAPLLKKCYREEVRVIPYELRKNILKISEELKRSFKVLYMAMSNLSNDAGDHMYRLQLYVNKKLRFYKRILMVKANRNMAMSAFQNDKYPGLVHFLYINRNNNTMKSPSIQLPKEDDGTEALVVRDMKVRLWRILPWMYKQMSNGYTSISVKDGDFVFTFDLFMYDEVHYRFLPRMVADPSLYSPPRNTIGEMKGHFYKRLIKKTDSVAGLKCLELLTVHFAVIPRDVISKQRTLLLENELHKKHDPLSTY